MTKREEVLQAAISCFSLYGYNKTTLSDIGKRVGMNKASLYYHFKDKLSLYQEVINYIRKEHLFKVSEQLEKLSSIEERIIIFADSELDFLSKIAVSYLHGTSGVNHETKIVSESIIEEDKKILSDLISDGVKNGAFEKCDSQCIAERLIQVVQGLLLVNCPLEMPEEHRAKGYELAKERTEDVIRLILKGLKTK